MLEVLKKWEKKSQKKETFHQNKKIYYCEMIFKLVKVKLWKFEVDCLKALEGDSFLLK